MVPRDVRLMYSLLRCGHGPQAVPGEVAASLSPQMVAVLRRAFSDRVDGDRLSTALAFAIADVIGPGSGELARSIGREETEGERLSMVGREAVCYFLLALMRARERLREEHRKEVDRLLLEGIYTLIKIYKQARQQLSLAALVMSGNPRIYEVTDDSVREFAKELASLLRSEPGEQEAREQQDQGQEPEPAPVRRPVDPSVARRLRRLRIAAMRARSLLEPGSP